MNKHTRNSKRIFSSFFELPIIFFTMLLLILINFLSLTGYEKKGKPKSAGISLPTVNESTLSAPAEEIKNIDGDLLSINRSAKTRKKRGVEWSTLPHKNGRFFPAVITCQKLKSIWNMLSERKRKADAIGYAALLALNLFFLLPPLDGNFEHFDSFRFICNQ